MLGKAFVVKDTKLEAQSFMTTVNFFTKSMVGLLGVACITLPATEAAQATSPFIFTTSQSEFTDNVRNQGWWAINTAGGTRPNFDANDNYLVGTLGIDNRFVHRDFFTFDLSSLLLSPTETITSATLELTRFQASTVDPTETLGLFDVSTDAATLNNNQGSNINIYNDLGTGTSYGEFVVDTTTGTPEDILSFTLNAAAIADIQSRAGQSSLNGFFSIGGALLSLSPSRPGNEYLFFNNVPGPTGGVQQLVITTAPTQNPETVPEPSTVAALFLTGFAAFRYRKKLLQDPQ